MPKQGQLKGTPARRAEFIEGLRLLGDGPECVYWPWSDKRDAYVAVHVDGQKVRSSRWVYEQINGPLPERHGRGARGVLVLHKCDNPPCVRPSHLFAGTQDDNMKDAAAKGRKVGGVGNHRPRLSSLEVEVIAAEAKVGSETQAEIARRHHVSQTTVSMIALGHRHPRWTVKPLTGDQIANAKSLQSLGVPLSRIARDYGVSRSVLDQALKRDAAR